METGRNSVKDKLWKFNTVIIQSAESSKKNLYSVWAIDISLTEITFPRRVIVIIYLPRQLMPTIKLNVVWRATKKLVFDWGSRIHTVKNLIVVWIATMQHIIVWRSCLSIYIECSLNISLSELLLNFRGYWSCNCHLEIWVVNYLIINFDVRHTDFQTAGLGSDQLEFGGCCLEWPESTLWSLPSF